MATEPARHGRPALSAGAPVPNLGRPGLPPGPPLKRAGRREFSLGAASIRRCGPPLAFWTGPRDRPRWQDHPARQRHDGAGARVPPAATPGFHAAPVYRRGGPLPACGRAWLSPPPARCLRSQQCGRAPRPSQALVGTHKRAGALLGERPSRSSALPEPRRRPLARGGFAAMAPRRITAECRVISPLQGVGCVAPPACAATPSVAPRLFDLPHPRGHRPRPHVHAEPSAR